ncbi:MAG TPA: choline dehydrogenase, partial [Aurantimonas coralicida]|nr:choline dehydrogenase [Aurantimonas coralicida]
VLDRVRDAAEAAGVAKIDDFNTGDNEGSAYFQVNQKGGRRWSAARGFLKPALGRPNLKVVTGVMVDRVRFRDGRAVSIDYRKDGKGFEALAAREIVLSAGAVGSPAILERSGVGDADRLKDHGIAPVHHLPGVGENLQDHLQIRPIYKVDGIKTLNSEYKNLFRRAMMGVDYALRRRGPLTMAPSQVGAFVKSSPDQATANLEFHFQPLSLDDWGAGLHPFSAFTASVCNLRPTSRGSIHLTGARPEDAPDIAPNYLSTDEDRQVAVDSLKWARRIVEQSPLAHYRPEEYKPGAHVTSDADMLVAAGDLGTTIFHPVGTAKMGIEGDPMAVLDERLRVRGIRGLRVADASVMPSITSGNTNSPTIMIAEKAARMILDDARADTNLR